MKTFPLLLAALLATPTAAQYVDEEGMRDHEEQDRRYLQRQDDRADEPETPDDSGRSVEEIRERFLAAADESIHDRNYRSATGERYRVQSDDPRVIPEAALDLLDGFDRYFGEFWKGRLPLRPYGDRSRVFLFYSFHKFNRLLPGDFRFRSARPKGHYGALLDVILLHTGADSPGGLADALVHEAAHQLVNHRLLAARASVPPWLSEGVASYFGYTYLDRKGSFHPSVVGGKEVRLLRDAKGRPGTEARARIKELRRTLKSSADRSGAIVDRVVSTSDPDAFYGEGAHERYSVSWLLVHYLLHGDDGAHAKSFASFLRRDDLSRAAAGDLYETIGMGPAGLEQALARHVRHLDVR